jgi:hypothetical protein
MQQTSKNFRHKKASRRVMMPVIAGGFAVIAGLLWEPSTLPVASFFLGVGIGLLLEPIARRVFN